MEKFNERIHKVLQLPSETRQEVEKMLSLSNGELISYQEISDWLKEKGYNIGKSSIWRYSNALSDKSKIMQRVDLNLLKLWEALSEKALETLDAQDIETVFALEKIISKRNKDKEGKQ